MQMVELFCVINICRKCTAAFTPELYSIKSWAHLSNLGKVIISRCSLMWCLWFIVTKWCRFCKLGSRTRGRVAVLPTSISFVCSSPPRSLAIYTWTDLGVNDGCNCNLSVNSAARNVAIWKFKYTVALGISWNAAVGWRWQMHAA